DSQPAFRAGLRSVLEATGLVVLGEADDPDEAVGEIARLRPAICVIDTNVRGSIGAISRITQGAGAPAVLVLAAAPSPEGLITVRRHLGAVAGKVGKRSSEQLLHLVRTA